MCITFQCRIEVAPGQYPFATIFSCVDARVPPELIFDRRLGDRFVIRTAGHVIEHAVRGSLELGAAELQIPLMMGLGHAKCGAVNATLEAVKNHAEAPNEIAYLVDHIVPAIEYAADQPGGLRCNSIKANVALTVEKLYESSILAEAVAQGQWMIVGAQYNGETGMGRISLIDLSRVS